MSTFNHNLGRLLTAVSGCHFLQVQLGVGDARDGPHSPTKWLYHIS